MTLPDGWTNIMPVECMYCRVVYNHKDGRGTEGTTSGICPDCRLVCDRCGAPIGHCHHYGEPDYVTQTGKQYREEMRMYYWTLAGTGTVLAVLMWMVLR